MLLKIPLYVPDSTLKNGDGVVDGGGAVDGGGGGGGSVSQKLDPQAVSTFHLKLTNFMTIESKLCTACILSIHNCNILSIFDFFLCQYQHCFNLMLKQDGYSGYITVFIS